MFSMLFVLNCFKLTYKYNMFMHSFKKKTSQSCLRVFEKSLKKLFVRCFTLFNFQKLAGIVFLIVCTLCNNFCAIPYTTSRDMTIKRILEKTEFLHHLVKYVHKNCTIVLSNSVYLVYKFLCDFIQ